jgi:predicted nucleotidyltransferase
LTTWNISLWRLKNEMVDISEVHLTIIRQILKKHIPQREVRALGSRTTGNAKAYSDLDLAVMGDKPLDIKTLALLKEDFCESDLPFRIDIIQWANTSPEFKVTITPQLIKFP